MATPSKMEQKTAVDDFTCPVCLYILIEPVTMPCCHVLCLRCFRQNVQHSSLRCPFCRARISSWTRKMNRQNCLVNRSLWASIQNKFPDKVQRCLERLNKQTDENIVSDAESDEGNASTVCPPPICEPGEIRKEFEELLTKANEEENRLRKMEELKSEQLIRQLQDEEQIEETRRSLEIRKDYLIAKRLAASQVKMPATVTGIILRSSSVNCNTTRTAAASLSHRCQSCNALSTTAKTKDAIDVKTPSKKLARRFVSYKKLPHAASESPSGSENSELQAIPGSSSSNGKETTKRSNSIESEDSITEELRHFRPIKVAPKTPPRLLPNGVVDEEPRVIHAMPRILTLQWDNEKAGCSSSSSSSNAAGLQKRLALVESDRRDKMAAYSKRGVERKRSVDPTRTEAEQQTMPHAIASALGLMPTRSVDSEPTVTAKRKSSDDPNNNCAVKRAGSDSAETEFQSNCNLIVEDGVDQEDLHRFTTDFEQSDQLLALKLQHQLNSYWRRHPYSVDRRKGTPDEYNLRRK